jgi:outer membrane protein TolC
MRFFALLLSAGSLIFPAGAQAAERTLGLDEALAMARRNNHDLEGARARLVQAQAGVEQAWAALLPQLAGQGKYTHNYKEVALTLPPEFSSGGPIIIQKGEQLDAAATLTMPIIAPAAYPSLTSARRTADSARANFDLSETTVLYQTAQTFFAAAGADELIAARQHAIEVAQKTLSDAKARLEAGTVNRVEVTRAEAALIRAQQSAVEAEAVRDQTYRSLRTLTGAKEPVHVVPPELPQAAPAASVPDALRLRPEIIAADEQIAAADAAAHAAGWRWAPTLSGFGNLRGFNYAGFSGDEYSWAVGLQLDWLLYDGGARDAQRHQAVAQKQEAEARRDLLRDTVGDEVANAEQQLQTRRLALEAAQRQAELSRETLELVRVQHQAGTATQLDLLAAQDALVVAEVGLAQARFDLQLGDLSLARAAGTFPQRSTR